MVSLPNWDRVIFTESPKRSTKKTRILAGTGLGADRRTYQVKIRIHVLAIATRLFNRWSRFQFASPLKQSIKLKEIIPATCSLRKLNMQRLVLSGIWLLDPLITKKPLLLG